MTFKLAVKTLAQKNGLHATFMPKPVSGAAGSGMHVNMSLFRDGKMPSMTRRIPGTCPRWPISSSRDCWTTYGDAAPLPIHW